MSKQGPHHKSRRLTEPTGYTQQAISLRRRLPSGTRPESATISIKYPLHTTREQLETISTWLTHDARQVAPVATYPPSSQYTLLSLWTDALRLGFIFGGSAADIYQFYHRDSVSTLFETVRTHLQDKHQVTITTTPETFVESYSKSMRDLAGKDFAKRVARKFVIMLSKDKEPPDNILAFASHLAGLIKASLSEHEQFSVLEQEFGTSPEAFRAPDGISLTCVPDPALSRTPLGESLSSEQVFYSRYLSLVDRVGEGEASKLLGFLPKFNNLSNFYGRFLERLLTPSSLDNLAKEIITLVPEWGREPERLTQVLSTLLARAATLQSRPLAPTVSSYADYRMLLGGKLQSWWTNYLGHRARLAESPAKITQDLNNLDKQQYPLAADILPLLKHLADPTTYDLCRKLLGDLREAVSRDTAKNAKPDEDWQKSLAKTYPALFGKLPKYPSFYGDTIASRISSLTTSHILLSQLFTHCLTLLIALPSTTAPQALDPKSETRLRRHLDNTVNLIVSLRTKALRTELTTHLVPLGLELYERTAKSRYYIHPRAERIGNMSQLPLPPNTSDLLLACDQAIMSIISSPIAREDWVRLADFIELAKRLAALRLAYLPPASLPPVVLPLQDTGLSWLPLAVYAPHLASTNPPKHRIAWFTRYLNREILSNLRGLLTQASRTHVLARTTLTHIGTDKRWPLVLAVDTSRPSGHLPPSLTDNLAYYHHSWYLALPQNDRTADSPLSTSLGYYKFEKNGQYQKTSLRELSKHYLLPIRSGYEQLQHLEILLHIPAKKRGLSISFGEPSLIYEQALERVGGAWQDKGDRLFVNYPFTLTTIPLPNVPLTPHTLTPYRYLGIDVGEYGLAYAVIQGDKEGKHCDLLTYGFLNEPEHRAVRQEVAALKSRQVAGTLTYSSTKLERLRDSVTSAYHHRLLNLAHRYSARLIFEHEIDAFETGGNRIKVLYRSLKQGLTLGDNETAKSAFRATWGRGKWPILPSGTVSAYATSTICPTCGRSLYQVDTVSDATPLGEYLYRATASSKYFGSTPVTLYTRTGKIDSNHPTSLIYAATRPPYQEGATGLLTRLASPPSDVSLRELAKLRGNQAIFVCPFTTCQGHTLAIDADLQAAVNIAVKQYSQDLFPVPTGKGKNDDSKPWEQKRIAWYTFIRTLVDQGQYPRIDLSL